VAPDAKDFQDTYDSITLIGQVTGTLEQANAIVSDMKARLAVIEEKAETITEPKKVWVEVSPQPDIFTTGSGTFVDEMLQVIRAENAAADQEGWVKYTEEEAVSLNPDVIVITYGSYMEDA